MGRRDHYDFRGGAKAPANRICGPAEVPPTGMGLCAARLPGTGGILQDGLKVPPGEVTNSLLPGRGDTHVGPDDNRISIQAYRYGDSYPKLDRTGELNSILCGHRVPHCSPMQPHQVQV